jgi:Bacteriophage tail sheath protein
VPNYRAPGVYIEEISSGSQPITPVGTSTAAFIGVARKGPVNKATFITSFAEFEKKFGGPLRILKGTQEHYLYYAVRHFFEQGGSRCYVVRIVHYQNPEVASSIQATGASRGFDGTRPNGNPVSPALTVTAISPGLWGQELEARVINSSKFSLRLAADIVAGNASQVSLVLNDQVQVGSLLWIVEEVVGRIESINISSGAVTFGTFTPSTGEDFRLKVGADNFSGQIDTNRPVFGPGFSYFGATSQAAAISVTNGVPSPADGIHASPVTKVDGTNLRPGDTLTFAITETRFVVNRVSVQSGTPVTTIAHFATQNLPAFVASRSRVYARDFTLLVRRQSEILEVHENLSLVNTNRTDHVDIRLGADSGASQYVTARDGTGTGDLVVMNNSAFLTLENGNDGLTGLQDADFIGSEVLKTGLSALTPVRDAAILVVPNASEAVTKAAISYCEKRGDLFLIVEKPSSSTDAIKDYRAKLSSKYAALYHPWIQVADQITGRPVLVPPSGAIAGIYALTDTRRGVHKAPAGLDTGKVVVADGVETILSKGEYDILYPLSINAILKLRDGIHVWGSRTLSADPEWLQINIRRLFNFLEKSIENGTQWVVFEPNGPTLWKSIERNIREFLRTQWLEGKLVGTTEKEAFFVHCNAETNPPEVVDAGQVVTVIGVAPSRPAEFVIFRIRQKVGQSAG